MTTHFTNPTIKRIVLLEGQIKLIQKHLDRGEHMAAGLSIELGIGANDEHPVPFEIGLGSEDVLRAILGALGKSLYYARQTLKREHDEVSVFLGREELS